MALILSEGLLLGISFDSDSLRQLPGGWWHGLSGVAGRVMPLAATLAAAALLIAGPRIRAALDSWTPTPSRTALFLAGHLAAFGMLFLLSKAVFGPAASVLRHPQPWVLAWLLASAATVALWLAALFPIPSLRVLVHSAGWLVLASLVIGLLAWTVGRYTEDWWTPLRGSTLRSAFVILRLGDRSAYADPSAFLIGAGNFIVEISPQCSGYEGIGLVCVFLVGYLGFFRRRLRWPQALLLLPAAAAAVWVANTLRIAALVVIGAHVSVQIALGGFHSYAGVLLFSGVALGTAAVARAAPFFSKCPLPRGRSINPAAPWLVPLLATIATCLIARLFSARGFDPYCPLAVPVAAALLWHYRHHYRSHAPGVSWVAVAVGILVFAVWIVMARRTSHPGSGPDILLQPGPMIWICLRVLGAVIAVPLVEELAFRGYLVRRLMASDFESVPFKNLSWTSMALSSLAFAVLHRPFAWGFIAGLAYAWLVRRRGRLADAVIAHSTATALLAAYALATHSWSL